MGYLVKDNIDTHIASSDAHGTTTAITGVDDTQTLTNKTINDLTNTVHSDANHLAVRNVSGGTLNSGTPVSSTGFNSGQDLITIDAADATASSTNPAIGILDIALSNNTNGHVITNGEINALDTSSYTVGDLLYVSETAGVLTNVRPTTTTSYVQAIAKVTKVHASSGRILVTGAGRSNDTPNSILGSTITVANTGSPAYTTAQHMQDTVHSAGLISGGVVTDGGLDTIDVTAGEGLLRATDNSVDELEFIDWSASVGISVPSDTTRYVGIEYNAGTPQAVVRTTNNFTRNNEFGIAVVTNESSTIHVAASPHKVADHANGMIERIHQVNGIQRDNVLGGIILGETGTRNITVSAGALWDRLVRTAVSAVDTSVAGTFNRYYDDGAGGHTKESAQTQWNNTQYDDGSGTLATLGANKYAVQWFYLTLGGALLCMYGTTEHNSAASATAESAPSDVPARISDMSGLIGRLIFKKSDATATAIETIFDTTFNGAVVTDHGNLAGLTDDDHTQYVLADGTRDIVGNQDIIGTAGVGIARTDGTLHVHTGSAGVVSANALADDLVIENSGDVGLSFLSPDADDSRIHFGSFSDKVGASIVWNHDADLMTLGTSKATAELSVVVGNSAEVIRITSDRNTRIGKGTTADPDGTLHVHTSSAGVVTADAAADDLIVESDGGSGISILAADAQQGSIYFGSPADNIGGLITYQQSTGLFSIGSHLATGQVVIKSGDGVEASRFDSDGGLYMAGATGDSQGSGTINATGLYVDGVSVVTDDALGIVTATVQTTTATQTTLQTIAIPTDEERIIIARVRCNEPVTGDSAWKFMRMAAKNDAGTVTLIGGIASDSGSDAGASTWDFTASVSSTNIIIQVTGEASHTIDWETTTEVT